MHGVEVGEGEVECSVVNDELERLRGRQQVHGVSPRRGMRVVHGLWGLSLGLDGIQNVVIECRRKDDGRLAKPCKRSGR